MLAMLWRWGLPLQSHRHRPVLQWHATPMQANSSEERIMWIYVKKGSALLFSLGTAPLHWAGVCLQNDQHVSWAPSSSYLVGSVLTSNP